MYVTQYEGLVSLYRISCWLNMEPFHPHTFYNIGKLLEKLASEHGLVWRPGSAFYAEPARVPTLDEHISKQDREDLLLWVSAMADQTRTIGLGRATEYAEDILRQLNEYDALTNRQIATLLRELDKHIRWDMEKQMFMYISPERARYYHSNKLLSSQTMDGFPTAGEEIMLAGDCYAAGCWTASVMHSMRSLEKPIHAVADSIGGINLPKAIEVSTWGEIHREIDKKVQQLRQTPLTPARDEEIAFYSNLNLEFGYFNDIWRRFVAHSRKSYDASQAKSALQHVIAFADQAAAKGLKETA